MKRPIHVALMSGKVLRRIIAVILLVLAGRTFKASGQTVTNLYSFIGTSSDGGNPQAPLIQGSDSNFYGTAPAGFVQFKTNNYGTVFRIGPDGSFTNLHSFNGIDGAYPIAGLVQGSDGSFYGTTVNAGITNFGTVFRISTSGSYTNLHSLVGSPGDGRQPDARLVQGIDGSFYGTTIYGGASTNCNFGCGTVFRFSVSGGYTNLYSFVGSPIDGANPTAGLVRGSDGNFYGTTRNGGANAAGTVFRISPNGSCTNLHSFGNSPGDAALPAAGLVQGSDGNFYGTTLFGGVTSPQNTSGYGVIFRINTSGVYTNLYSFVSPPGDGNFPTGGLVQGSDGRFYGTTQQGGANGNGIIYRITPNGSYTNLYPFAGYPNDGSQPNAGLVQGGDGNFYGTTTFGGINNSGTVYRLSVPINPPPYPINQITNAQVATTDIVLSVVSIAGETYQLQFSSSMNPTNWVNVPGVSVTNSIGALLTLTNFGGALQPQGFYRFDITP